MNAPVVESLTKAPGVCECQTWATDAMLPGGHHYGCDKFDANPTLELLRRLKATFYACNVALDDLKDGCNDDGETGEALREAINEATNKHVA